MPSQLFFLSIHLHIYTSCLRLYMYIYISVIVQLIEKNEKYI